MVKKILYLFTLALSENENIPSVEYWNHFASMVLCLYLTIALLQSFLLNL